MKIAIVVGSIREGRVGLSVGQWVAEQAQGREASYEVVDLKEFDVPLLTSAVPPMGLNREYGDPAIAAWGAKMDEFDAYIFVTPEYNHSVPGSFKNAVDVLGPEWVGKAIGFVGYGSVGGVRAIEHWRTIVVNFQMVDVRAEVNLSLFTDFADGEAAPKENSVKSAQDLFDQLEAAAAK